MKRLIAGSLSVILIVVGALCVVGYLKYQQMQAAASMPPPPEMPMAVATYEVKQGSYRRKSVVIGTVLASQSVTLRNELTGVVTEVAVKPGDLVRKGQVLLRQDTELESAELKSALATKTLADDSLARNQRLENSGAGSAQLLETATADVARATAEVERLQATIAKKTLVAPFDARVGLFDIHPGQYLPAGTEITELAGVSDFLKIDFAMPQLVASSVGVGDTVDLLVTSLSEPLSSTIIAVDASANLQSRSLLARSRIDSPPATLHPGDSVKVVIPYGAEVPAVAVPSTSIRRGPTGTNVFVAVDKGDAVRAESRPVVVIGSQGTQTWVGAGLQEGDRVVTDGSFKVREGTLLGRGAAS